jgi:hypothetical protein
MMSVKVIGSIRHIDSKESKETISDFNRKYLSGSHLNLILNSLDNSASIVFKIADKYTSNEEIDISLSDIFFRDLEKALGENNAKIERFAGNKFSGFTEIFLTMGESEND